MPEDIILQLVDNTPIEITTEENVVNIVVEENNIDLAFQEDTVVNITIEENIIELIIQDGLKGEDGQDGDDGQPGPNLIDSNTATKFTGFLYGNGSSVEAQEIEIPEEIIVHHEFVASSVLRSFILYSDIIGTPPEGTVFDIAEDNSNFAVMLPIPFSYTSGKGNLKFFKGEEGLDITEGIRHYVAGRNQCPLSLDWVFAFKCNNPYDAGADEAGVYRITFDERIILFQIEAIPFSKDIKDTLFNSSDADNLMLPKLPSPYVYQLHRWIRKDVSAYGNTGKKQGDLGVMKVRNMGTCRFRLACRGDIGEYILKDIASRSDSQFRFFMTGWNSASPRLVPFKISIYNTETGATSFLSHTYGQQQTSSSISYCGLKRVLEK